MTSDGNPYARFRRALETGNETLVVAAACLAGDAPTAVTDAIQVVPANPATAKPEVLPAATLTKAAAVACTTP